MCPLHRKHFKSLEVKTNPPVLSFLEQLFQSSSINFKHLNIRSLGYKHVYIYHSLVYGAL